MISKELLSKVLGLEIIEISYTVDSVRVTNSSWHKVNRETELVYYTEDNIRVINIHELAHKCKKWAFNKNNPIDVYMNDKVEVDLRYGDKTFCEDTEPEAIFKACGWILKKNK